MQPSQRISQLYGGKKEEYAPYTQMPRQHDRHVYNCMQEVEKEQQE